MAICADDRNSGRRPIIKTFSTTPTSAISGATIARDNFASTFVAPAMDRTTSATISSMVIRSMHTTNIHETETQCDTIK